MVLQPRLVNVRARKLLYKVNGTDLFWAGGLLSHRRGGSLRGRFRALYETRLPWYQSLKNESPENTPEGGRVDENLGSFRENRKVYMNAMQEFLDEVGVVLIFERFIRNGCSS